jgi:hypothetical protein
MTFGGQAPDAGLNMPITPRYPVLPEWGLWSKSKCIEKGGQVTQAVKNKDEMLSFVMNMKNLLIEAFI